MPLNDICGLVAQIVRQHTRNYYGVDRMLPIAFTVSGKFLITAENPEIVTDLPHLVDNKCNTPPPVKHASPQCITLRPKCITSRKNATPAMQNATLPSESASPSPCSVAFVSKRSPSHTPDTKL